MKFKNQFFAALFVFTLYSYFSTPAAQAAQVAQVIVTSANVYLYPQSGSKVISKLPRGESLAISNLPTEGFYKVRLASGDMGWVSGNDILSNAGSGTEAAIPIASEGDLSESPKAESRMRTRRPTRRKLREDAEEAVDPNDDSFRFMAGYGAQFPSLGGLSGAFTNTSSLNPGKHFGFEVQFRMSHTVYWSIRVESISASSSSSLSATNTQALSIKEIPIQFGLVWSPITQRRFRLGLGAYLGGVPSAKASVTQTDSSTLIAKTVEYSTVEAVATAAVQMSFGLGDRIGVYLEAAYRYDQTSQNPDTTIIATIPGFKINYSGPMVTAGLEFKL
jgi:hypothetical protein